MTEIIRNMTFDPMLPIPVISVVCIVLIVFKRRGITPFIRQILISLLLFVINLRPMYLSDSIRVQKQKIDLNVIMVADDTISMIADDQAGYDTRLDLAKRDMKYIIENLPGARFSLICFNNSTHVMTPFTDSADYLYNAIDSIYPLSPAYATGTNISVCINALTSSSRISNTSDEEGETIIFILSDGENTDGNPQESFAKLRGNYSGGAVLGYGTSAGGHMNYYDSFNDEYMLIEDTRDPSTAAAVTKIDEANLRSIADDLAVPYFNRSEGNAFEQYVEQLRNNYEAKPDEELRPGYADIYYIAALPLTGLIAYEFISLRRRG